MELKIVLSDLQAPYHDRRAVASVCNMLADRAASISEVHQIGDFYDFTGISRWVDGSLNEGGLQKELDASVQLLEDLSKAYGGPKTRILGNHDDRLRKYLNTKAKGLADIRVLEFDNLTEAARWGWGTKKEPYSGAPGVAAGHRLFVGRQIGYKGPHHL